jgi:hypothetical protein
MTLLYLLLSKIVWVQVEIQTSHMQVWEEWEYKICRYNQLSLRNTDYSSGSVTVELFFSNKSWVSHNFGAYGCCARLGSNLEASTSSSLSPFSLITPTPSHAFHPRGPSTLAIIAPSTTWSFEWECPCASWVDELMFIRARSYCCQGSKKTTELTEKARKLKMYSIGSRTESLHISFHS